MIVPAITFEDDGKVRTTKRPDCPIKKYRTTDYSKVKEVKS